MEKGNGKAEGKRGFVPDFSPKTAAGTDIFASLY